MLLSSYGIHGFYILLESVFPILSLIYIYRGVHTLFSIVHMSSFSFILPMVFHAIPLTCISHSVHALLFIYTPCCLHTLFSISTTFCVHMLPSYYIFYSSYEPLIVFKCWIFKKKLLIFVFLQVTFPELFQL